MAAGTGVLKPCHIYLGIATNINSSQMSLISSHHSNKIQNPIFQLWPNKKIAIGYRHLSVSILTHFSMFLLSSYFYSYLLIFVEKAHKPTFFLTNLVPGWVIVPLLGYHAADLPLFTVSFQTLLLVPLKMNADIFLQCFWTLTSKPQPTILLRLLTKHGFKSMHSN